ncbi:unnamed protein product [Thelazia callipaeda]|uniref:Adhesion G protein-coupled receptor L3 n=1 Tax=Thelazia callipaeda TaxID=103827 RepID=A0A158RBU7_THECL|nr:unnamed protein product [Thelazia callipaeda]
MQCNISINEEQLGDPCPDTEKYLDVEYECSEATINVTSTSSTALFDVIDDRILSKINTVDTTKSSLPTKMTKSRALENAGDELFCAATVERDADWPRTRNGMTAHVPCPVGSTGHAEWVCDPFGRWDSEGPDLFRCVSTWSKGILMDAEEVEDSADRLEFLREIQLRTRRESLLGGDLITLSRALNLLIPSMVYDSDADHYVELVVESVNNMAKGTQSVGWRDLKGVKRRMIADMLMNHVDKVSAVVSTLITSDSPRIIMKPNIDIELEISAVRVHNYVTFPSMSLYRSTEDTIEIPREALTLRDDTVEEAKMVYAAYSSLAQYIEPEPRQDEYGTLIPRQISSKIVSALVINSIGKAESIDHLGKPVVITFSTEHQANLSAPQCVWWNRTRLQWSSYGCLVSLHNSTHTVCHCNHLTHYAVLMDIHHHQLTVEHNIVLTFITYAGCTLSILCLFLSLIAFHCFGISGGDRIFIHQNLCFSLFMAETIFLAGIWQTSDPLRCSIIAGILHYFFLAAFSWMLLEGFELYYMLVKVFQPKDSKRPYLILFGYGFPLVVVAISIWFDRFSYGTDRYCWLRSDNYFILAFVAPVAAVLLANTIFIVMTLFIVCRHSNIGYTPCKQDSDALKNVRNWLKGSVALVSLLGLTWTFGLLWIDEQSILMAYAFTTFNSLQGLFIFLFHVAFNDRLHKDYRNWANHSFWAPRCIRDDPRHTSHAVPYLPTSAMIKSGQVISSGSSTGSELLKFAKYFGGTSDRYSPFLACQQTVFIGKEIYERRVVSCIKFSYTAFFFLSFLSLSDKVEKYPSVSEKYPSLPAARMIATIDPRYSNSVQILPVQQRHNPSNSIFLICDDLSTSSCNYCHQFAQQEQQQQQHYYHNHHHQSQQKYYPDCYTPITFVPNTSLIIGFGPELATSYFRPPPNFPPPPPPPTSASSSVPSGQLLLVSSAGTITRMSDDSAYSDSSASTLQCHGEIINRSAMLLRMDLSKNPPVFVQGL